MKAAQAAQVKMGEMPEVNREKWVSKWQERNEEKRKKKRKEKKRQGVDDNQNK